MSDSISSPRSSEVNVSTSSPYRRRFDRRTRREALENLLKKSPKKKVLPSSGPTQDESSTTPSLDHALATHADQHNVVRISSSLASASLSSEPEDEKKSLTSGNTTVTTANSTVHAPASGYSALTDDASDQAPRNPLHMVAEDAGDTVSSSFAKRVPQHMESQEERYYRIVYRGVVALVTRPDSKSPKSGAYLSYGEIISSQYELDVEELESVESSSLSVPKLQYARSPVSSEIGLPHPSPDSPPRSVMSAGGSVSSLDTLKTASSVGIQKPFFPPRQYTNVIKRAIRVDKVLTGGYALDAPDSVPPTPREDAGMKTPKRSNAHYLPLLGPSPFPLSPNPSLSVTEQSDTEEWRSVSGELGYLFDQKRNTVIAEALPGPPNIETGKFVYQITSSTPLNILTGPCIDAPKTKAILLPGTMHEVCLKLSVNEGKVTFLRLSHRRGWITDRKISFADGIAKVVAIPAVKEVSLATGRIADESSISALSIASSSAVLTTPGSVARRRHRPPRRKREAAKEGIDTPSVIRQVGGGQPDPFNTPAKGSRSSSRETPRKDVSPVPVRGRAHGELSPTSNISMLSDDDLSADYSHSRTEASTPDRSAAHSQATESRPLPSFYLMRVNAPHGLKILDAPHFQVSNLIHGQIGSAATTPASSPHVRSESEAKPKSTHSIFQTMGGTLSAMSANKGGEPAVFDSVKKNRILPRGALFEASKRMESSGSFTQGAGLVKLADNSGWAIIPHQSDLDFQYRNYHGRVANVKEGEATRAFEEVGNTTVTSEDEPLPDGGTDSVWFRVVGRNGVTVECAPNVLPPKHEEEPSPASSAAGSSLSGAGSNFGILTSHDSDVASSVGSAFLDAMFRTPKKQADGSKSRDHSARKGPYAKPTIEQAAANTIPCGMCVEVDRWDTHSASSEILLITHDYVRLRGGQGWIPRVVEGKPVLERIPKPDIRFGSFWFRVLSQQGIKVRLGPSRRASSIKSEDNIYFRFECGEFLRASEVVTIFRDKGHSESFAKLYRNRHVKIDESQINHRLLSSFTASAEWVQVFGGDSRLYLEECGAEPRIQRHRDGWRYNVVFETGISVRKGPSFSAEATGIVLLPGESILINEQVTPPGEQFTWLRLKDAQGWVHDVTENGERMLVAHSLRHRARTTLPRPHKTDKNVNDEIAYNTIVARLFTPDGGLATDQQRQRRQGNQGQPR